MVQGPAGRASPLEIHIPYLNLVALRAKRGQLFFIQRKIKYLSAGGTAKMPMICSCAVKALFLRLNIQRPDQPG